MVFRTFKNVGKFSSIQRFHIKQNAQRGVELMYMRSHVRVKNKTEAFQTISRVRCTTNAKILFRISKVSKIQEEVKHVNFFELFDQPGTE